MSTVVTFISMTSGRTLPSAPEVPLPRAAARPGTLGSLQALALAVTASLLTTGAMWLAH